MGAIESLFGKALKVESPWEIEKVEFVESEGRINVVLDFPRGSLFPCPRCQKAATAYDTTQKRWRHMNFFQYACYFVVRIPRIDCEGE
jgi:transposase